MMKREMKTKIGIIAILAISLHSLMWCTIIINSKYNNMSNKLDMIIENTNDSKVDSLQMEIMDLGQKLDSMVLKYDYNWEF